MMFTCGHVANRALKPVGSRRRITVARVVLLGAALVLGTGQAWGQDSAAAAQAAAQRPTGLPKKFKWTFNFDAGAGAFGFANSLYTNPHEDPSGDLSDNWWESFVKPALSATLAVGKKGELYGKISTVGERTFAAPPPLVGTEAASFQPEELYLGYRSGSLLDLTVGRAPYKIGQGFLLWDGGGEGGSRGGFWSNARKAWAFAGVARLTPKHHRFEAFYLDRNEVPESQTGTRLWGLNYELSLGDATTLGVSYLDFQADPAVKATRDGMSVVNARAFSAPLKSVPGLSFALEYAKESNGDLLSSTAWTAQGAYEFGKIGWKPKISYRYAFFEGDDPATSKNEGFDMLLPGFYDWGTWWQGEIAGEYFLSNSNLISHQARLHLTPSDKLSGGLIGYAFMADHPASFGPGVTSKNIATELDGYADWKVNSNFTISFLAAVAHPQEAVTQGYDRTKNFVYGMLYIAYAY
jgi:hypothetical protein